MLILGYIMMGKISKNAVRGFTIVELLVVIVVIGILATITVLAYNAVTDKARDAAITSDLDNNSRLLELYKAENGKYPTELDNNNCPKLLVPDTTKCLKISNGNTLKYSTLDSDGLSFGLSVSNGTKINFVTDGKTIGQAGGVFLSRNNDSTFNSATRLIYDNIILNGIIPNIPWADTNYKVVFTSRTNGSIIGSYDLNYADANCGDGYNCFVVVGNLSNQISPGDSFIITKK